MATTYPDAKHVDSLAIGELYQELIKYLLKRNHAVRVTYFKTLQEQYNIGESLEGLEIKLDLWCTLTNRLSIEVGEKTNLSINRFTPSGILRRDNTFLYLQGNFKKCWIFNKSDLLNYYKKHHPQVTSDNPSTIQKFYLNLRDVTQISLNYINILPIVCEFSTEPYLAPWSNCLPCPFYKDGDCRSEGAYYYERINFYLEAEGLTNAKK